MGSGGGLFDAYAYRGAGDGWGYRGLGLPANPWQEPFGRATLKAAISAIVAGAVLGSYPFIALLSRNLRRAAAGAIAFESAYR